MKFFNSDKSGFLSFVAKRMKALFALFFIIAGVQTLSAALVKGGWDGWLNHDLIYVADNEYYVDIEMKNAATDEFGIEFNGSFYSLSNKTITNWCSFEKFYTNNSNCKFTHNAGKYRFRVWDYGNYKTLTITGIIVTIDQPVQNADGSYTITGRFTNANPDQQTVNHRRIVFTEGVDHGVGANETATTVGEDGSFSITKQLDEGQQYTCCARVIDGSIGNHDSEYITFTAEAATPEPEPTVTDLYIFGVDDWSNPSDEWKCTSVSQDGNFYTWDWPSAPKTFNGGTYFKVGAKNAENTGIDDNNNYGPSGSDATLDFNGVQSIVQTVVNSSQSKAFTVSSATEISKIEFDKSDLTVTFYAPVETPTPVYSATITADASASQQTAKQVTLTSSLTEAAAGTDLTSATCQFQYLSADAAEGTEYSNLEAPVAYKAEGASLTTTALPQGGKYLFRAVWTLNGEVVATSDPSEATCVYPIWPKPEMFDVVWIPTYNTSDGSVTITAEISAKEDACFVMGQIVGLVANIFVDDTSQATSMSNPSGAENNKATATATIQNVNEGQELAYRLELTTGASQQVLGRGGIQIPGGTYVVEGEAYVERFPVTVNKVNGENGSVVTDPSDITNMAIGETVTVTTTANEGYVALFEATSGCVMTDGSADNIKVFKITEANPVITVTFQVQCETVKPGFEISGQFNAGMASPWVGTPINSREDDPANGCFAGGDEGDTNLFDARKFTLTANSVPANYFLWECAGYALDGTSMDIPEITWANEASQSATATVNLPGTYTFRLKAKCNESDEWTESAAITITAPVPEIGFDGEDDNIGDWQHAWAGQGGLMTRQSGTLTWKSNAFTLGNLASEFVIIQRYKLGCVGDLDGWDGYQDNGCDYHGNKINYADLELNGINGGTGGNFSASNTDAWVANETQLQLTVTMTGYDSYTVELAKKQEQIYAYYSSNDVTKGTVAMKVGDTQIVYRQDITAYIGQQVTLTAMPAQGYKVASWEINGKVTESDRTTISPTLSGAGLNVVVTFERDCYSGVVYDLTGGGIICANGGSTELSLSTLNNVTYQLYKDGVPYDKAVPVQGNGEAAKWTISEAGTYTAKAYDSRFAECQEQAIDMNGRAEVTTVPAPKIKVNPGDNVHLTVLQARSFTADVPVEWSITEATGSGDYCKGDGYMISSQTDTSLVAKFLCVGTAKITATMKAPNQNCMAEVTVTQNGAETEACAPEPEDMQ